jgi:hypothetical protein
MDESFFERISGESEAAESTGVSAPSRLKSRIYSTLVRRQEQSGPLLTITETKAKGRRLCVFENVVEISPLGEKVKSLNFCRVCHARVLAESIENAPIYWSHCPYVKFQNR